MKLSFLAAAALTAAATFIPAPAKADGNMGVIALGVCANLKAGMPMKRASQMALRSNVHFFKQLTAIGYTPSEIGKGVGQQVGIFCPEAIR
jgi:hypothetical protein